MLLLESIQKNLPNLRASSLPHPRWKVWNIQPPLPTAQFWPAAQHAAATSRPLLGATSAGTLHGMGPGGGVEKPRRSNGI